MESPPTSTQGVRATRAGGAAGAASGPLTGRKLGDFVIGDRLGQGAFGEVYRAEQPLLSREAAVKVMKVSHQREDAFVQRFLREARAASLLDHPYAAHVYAFGAETDGVLWLAMELVRGTSLADLIRGQGPLTLERFVPFFERICEVVHTAHEQGLVHRDLKPANVMVLARAGRLLPKLLDFGIARLRIKSEPEAPPPEVSPSALLAAADTVSVGPSTELTERIKMSGGRLTEGGGNVVGSPAYMAPEQWVNPADADARADQYALGVLAFECLTGDLPFKGGSQLEVAAAHAKAPLPSLGDGLPAALHGVLKRAVAKRANDRFGTVIELAEAVRAAAGGVAEGAGAVDLPRLDDDTLATLIAGAPQPLAEAATILETAHTPRHAFDAVVLVARIAVAMTRTLALASVSRVGGLDKQDDARPLLDQLTRQGLGEVDSWRLVVALVKPFVDRRALLPVPDLAEVTTGADAADIEDALATIARFATSPEAAAGPEDWLRAALAECVPALGKFLHRMGFLFRYPWLVGRKTRNEKWMGVRWSRRENVNLPKPLGDGKVAVRSPEGAVLDLSPLAQAAPPSPGAADEIFLYDGPGRHGARLVSLPQGFERQDEGLSTWLGQELGVAVVGGVIGAASDVAPYRGLAAFSVDDANMFFGREREVEAFANRLRIQALLAVVGPSGAGKSSFVQAGVLAGFPTTWKGVVTRPGSTPRDALRARLTAAGYTTAAAAVDRPPQEFAAALGREATERAQTITLVVDQFEELLTLCLDVEERTRFAAMLVALATSGDDHLRVILTMRDDFLIRLQQITALRDHLAPGLQLLATPAPDDLKRILEEPSRRAGFELEDGIAKEMVESVKDQPGALALLSFTAERMWALRDRHFRRLTKASYDSLGGVGGALAAHAEATMGALAEGDRGLVREAFRHLATAEGTRAVMLRRELLEVMGGAPGAAARVIEALVQARLLVASEGAAGDDRIEVIHEALLGSWPRLVRWLREDAENARLRDQLRAAARQWNERNRARGLLWRDDALNEYKVWRARYPGRVTDVEDAFARASLAEESRGRRIRRGLIAAAFVSLAIVVVWLLKLNTRAEQQRAIAADKAVEAQQASDRARARLAGSYAEQGRRANLDADPLRAGPYLFESSTLAKPPAWLGFVLHDVVHQLSAQRGTLVGHTAGGVTDARLSADASIAATSGNDGMVRLYTTKDQKPLAKIEVGAGVLDFDLSADGTRVVIAADTTIKLHDAHTGAMVAELAKGDGRREGYFRTMVAEFSRDGSIVATGDANGTVALWNGKTGAPIATLAHLPAPVILLTMSPDGAWLYAADFAFDGFLYDVKTRKLVRKERPHEGGPTGGGIFDMSWSPDSETYVTSGEHDCAIVRERATGKVLHTFTHVGNVPTVAFSPDGNRIATGGSIDQLVKVWSAYDGSLTWILNGHRGQIMKVVWSPDGDTIYSAGQDGTTQLWEVSSGARTGLFAGHVGAVNSVFATAGLVVTASEDGTARLWDAHARIFDRRLEGHVERVQFIRYARDGKRLLSASIDKTLKVWDPATGKTLQTFTAHGLPQWQVGWDDVHDRVALLTDTESFVPIGRFPQVWDLESGQKLAQFMDPTAPVIRQEFSPDGETVAILQVDGNIRLWKWQTPEKPEEWMVAEGMFALTWSADGSLLGYGDGTAVVLRDVATHKERIRLEGMVTPVSDVRFSGDGKRVIAIARDGLARVWEVASGKQVALLEGHTSDGLTAVLDHDGRLAVTTSYDGSIRVHDVELSLPLLTYGTAGRTLQTTWIDMAPDGRHFASAHPRYVRLWDLVPEPEGFPGLAQFLECHSPFAVEGERLQRRSPKCP